MDRDEALDKALDAYYWHREENYSDHTKEGKAAFLASLDASGWAVVPKEPTAEMINASADVTYFSLAKQRADVYRAMLAASQEKDRPHE